MQGWLYACPKRNSLAETIAIHIVDAQYLAGAPNRNHRALFLVGAGFMPARNVTAWLRASPYMSLMTRIWQARQIETTSHCSS